MDRERVIQEQYVRVEAIAQIFGRSVRRIQQLTQDGVLETCRIPGEGRRYDLEQAVEAYIRYLRKKAEDAGKSEKTMKLREQKLEAEIALKESQGELHKMKTEIAAGKYIGVDEVELDYQRFFTTFKRFALGIPSRLVSMVSDSLDPLEARRVEKELASEVKRMLQAFVAAGNTPGAAEKKERKKRAKA